jgi:hypothetical protein
VKKKQYPTHKSRYMITELRRFDRYVSQFKFLHSHGLESKADLLASKENLTSQIDTLTERRMPLYDLRKVAVNEEEKQYISDEIAGLYKALRDLRREWRLCGEIESSRPQIQENLQRDGLLDIKHKKEELQHERRSGNR